MASPSGCPCSTSCWEATPDGVGTQTTKAPSHPRSARRPPVPSRVLFRGVRLVDPASGHDGPADVLIEDEQVQAVGSDVQAHPKADVIDGAGLVMAPGLVDLHTHLREP